MKKEINVASSFAKRVGAVAGAAVVGMTMWVGLGGSMGAAPRAFIPEGETCLPSCPIDGRHLVVAGDDNTTLAATAITVGLVFTEESLEPNGNFQLFDGDRDPANWDVPFNDGTDPIPDADAPNLIVELWADPNGNGAEGVGSSLVAFWTPDLTNVDPLNQGVFPTTLNDWAGVSFLHSAAALEDGVADGTGIYQYAVRILPYQPLVDKGWNAFKVRANGTVTLVSSQVVGFIASMGESQEDFDTIYPPPGFPNTVYDGEWEFLTTLPAGLEDVTVFDGDMDFGNARFVAPASVFCDYKDTDDADTPATPPGFANAAAFPEGVATGGAACTNVAGTASGQPADDTDALAYQRVPTLPGVPNGIGYQLEAPGGQVFLNRNPSGNREWEQFKIQKVTHVDDLGAEACPVGGFPQTAGYDPVTDLPTDREYPASDCRTMTLPGGQWTVRLNGMDMQNLNFWFFSFKVEPVEPPCEGEECPGNGVIAPTTETCADYASGEIETENTIFYRKQGNNISGTNPGVIFYYAAVTVAPGEVLSVTQTVDSGTGPLFGVHDTRLYTDTCNGLGHTASYNAATGEVTFGGANVAAGGTFIIRIKWSVKSLIGKPVPNPTPGLYTFMAELDGVPVPSSKNDTPLALTQK